MRVLNKFMWIAFSVAVLSSCKKTDSAMQSNNIVPESMNIPLPSSISSTTSGNGGRLSGGRLENEESSNAIPGSIVYNPLRAYIWIGDQSGKFLSEIIYIIWKYNLSSPKTFSFKSNDDLKTKNVAIVQGGAVDGVSYQYKMTITDSILNQTAMEVFWNTNPISGVAIFNYYAINNNNIGLKSTMYRVDYTESSPTYDKTMLVQISDLPTLVASYPNKFKMFVGKKGSQYEIFGNSNHPDIIIPGSNGYPGNDLGERNYAFRARANDQLNIAVAEIGLPPSSVTGTADLLTTYSIKNVFYQVIHSTYTSLSDSDINGFLTNLSAPGYFNGDNFIGAGTVSTTLTGFTSDFTNLSSLTPYAPSLVRDLEVVFK